ncbi:MAG: asparagine synthase (glutamine-hydrolyzing) [Planctomycetota bacterium]
MCGIAGFLSQQPDSSSAAVEQRLAAMTARLTHRGPDSTGIFAEQNAGLAMRRLAIVGVESGQQPIFCEDRRFALVGNGEIYNSVELRRELSARGHRFQGASDLEVVLHLFEERGVDAFAALNGMFALAILELGAQRLVLARDRVGIKPLFYAQAKAGFLFASELPALAAALEPGDSSLLEVDPQALSNYLQLGYVPAPHTIYRGIRRLEPGQLLTIDARGLQLKTWWQWPALAAEERPLATWASELDALLRDSVRLQTMGDVRAGALLSGGLDSSAITALLARQSAQPIDVFTLAIDDPDLNEIDAATLTARAHGCNHHVAELRGTEIDEVESLFLRHGEPFADVSLLPTARLAQLAARHVKFALSGDGGDELFAGYAWLHHEARLRRLPSWIQRTASHLRPCLAFGQRARGGGLRGRALRALGDLAVTPRESFLRRRSLVPPSLIAQLLHPRWRGIYAGESDASRFAANWQGDELTLLADLDRRFYLPGDILEKVDRATMMSSLEARVPFLDHRIVEFAARIPLALQLGPLSRGKEVLRAVIEPLVPAPLLTLKKRGFGIPIDRWLRGSLGADIAARLLDPEFAELELLEPRGIKRLIAEHARGRANNGHMLWGLASLATCLTRGPTREPRFDAVANRHRSRGDSNSASANYQRT